jgi:endonuclease-8
MPEGHTIHRLAQDHAKLYLNKELAVSSPQGRFSDGAAELDGQTFIRAEALGKHLLYHWSETPLVLHIHLGLFGRFRNWRGEAPEPKGAIRLRVTMPNHTTDLSGPTACELLDPVAVDKIRARIGPDPLGNGDVERFVTACAKTRRSIAAVLMDQKAIAGVGNVYRAEMLYRARLAPMTPAKELREETVRGLWDDACMLLKIGVQTKRIVTVRPDESPGRRTRDGRHWVYKRASCRTCSQDIETASLANRTLYWCPSCQVETR